MKNIYSLFLFIALVSFNFAFANPIDFKEALEKASNLPAYGVLKQKGQGMIYLDVSNEYISALTPLLQLPGKLRTPSVAEGALGAHIWVFSDKENITPDEIGTSFSFTVKEIKNITVKTSKSLYKQWVIAVESKDLESLRQKYGLAPQLSDGFYIALGQQVPTGPIEPSAIETLSPYDYLDDATVPLAAKGDFTVVAHEQLLQTACKVDAIGKLCLQNNGFVYMDVSNDYIHSLVPHLPLKGHFEPLPTNLKATGAHISVIYEAEMINNDIWELKENGQWFTFTVKELRYVDRITPKGKKRLWILAVDAPGLQRLRKSYGLKPKLNGHDFHITLGNEELQQVLPHSHENEPIEKTKESAAAA